MAVGIHNSRERYNRILALPFSYKGYIKLSKRFLKRAKKDFNSDVRVNITTLEKNPTCPEKAQRLNSLSKLTKEIFDNSHRIKITMVSENDISKEYISSHERIVCPEEVILTTAKKHLGIKKFIF